VLSCHTARYDTDTSWKQLWLRYFVLAWGSARACGTSASWATQRVPCWHSARCDTWHHCWCMLCGRVKVFMAVSDACLDGAMRQRVEHQLPGLCVAVLGLHTSEIRLSVMCCAAARQHQCAANILVYPTMPTLAHLVLVVTSCPAGAVEAGATHPAGVHGVKRQGRGHQRQRAAL
jgi:hypothetical protein